MPPAAAPPPAAARGGAICPDVPVFTSRDGKTYVVALADRELYSGNVALTIYTATTTYGANLPIAITQPAYDKRYRSAPLTIVDPSAEPFDSAEITFEGTGGPGGCTARIRIAPYSDANIDARVAFAELDTARPPVLLLKVIGESSSLTCKVPYADAGIDGSIARLDYPLMARELGVTGTTFVKVTLDATGAVTGTAVYRSSGSSLLDGAAMKSAAATHYRPELFRCEPIPGSFLFKASFGIQ